MPPFHHRKLPDYSTLLSGHAPPNDIGFTSDRLQIWYNDSKTGWSDSTPHYHTQSDECFIVLEGSLLLEVEGERYIIGPGEFCCFPSGVSHSIIEAHPPYRTLMVRAPSVNDKVYRDIQGD